LRPPRKYLIMILKNLNLSNKPETRPSNVTLYPAFSIRLRSWRSSGLWSRSRSFFYINNEMINDTNQYSFQQLDQHDIQYIVNHQH
jgi:hypothetical protein